MKRVRCNDRGFHTLDDLVEANAYLDPMLRGNGGKFDRIQKTSRMLYLSLNSYQLSSGHYKYTTAFSASQLQLSVPGPASSDSGFELARVQAADTPEGNIGRR